MNFICLHCRYEAAFPDQEPDKWVVAHYAGLGEYRHKCPVCGAAMAAESFLRLFPGPATPPAAFGAFSDCANAEICVGYDQYAPDCEQPWVKTKCLASLHTVIRDLGYRLDALERRLPPSDSAPPAPPAEPTPRRRSRETTHGP